MTTVSLKDRVIHALEEMKAQDLVVLDVRHLTSVTDFMIICSGTSSRHVKAIADKMVEDVKSHGFRPLGSSGEESCEWVLVDLADVVVHVMQPEIRDFYQLEKLWGYVGDDVRRRDGTEA